MRTEQSYLDECMRDACDSLDAIIRLRAKLGDSVYSKDTRIARITPEGKPIAFIAKDETK